MAGLGAEQDEDFFQRALRLGCAGRLEAPASGEVRGVSDQLLRHFGRRHDVIDETRGNGAARHAVEFGRFGILRDDQAVLALDGANAKCAVGPGAGKDDPDGALALVLGEGAEEEVDGQTLSARRRGLEQLQRAVEQRHVVSGRDDVGAVRLHHHAVGHLMHRHLRVALDQIAEDAFVVGREMLHEDERHVRTAIGRQAREESLESGKTAGRGADSHDGETWDRHAGGLPGSRLAQRSAAAFFQTRHHRPTCPSLQGANGERWWVKSSSRQIRGVRSLKS